MYKIQTAKYGSTWVDCDWEQPFNTLEEAIQAATQQDGDGKMHFRVVNSDNIVMWIWALSYDESVYVDCQDKEYKWMDAILEDYSLPKEMLLKGILAWLSRNVDVKV